MTTPTRFTAEHYQRCAEFEQLGTASRAMLMQAADQARTLETLRAWAQPKPIGHFMTHEYVRAMAYVKAVLDGEVAR